MALPPLRIGFVGGHGHHFLRAALRDPGLRIEAVAIASDGVDAEAARRKFADELAGGATWHGSVEAMLADAKPTVVNVGGVYAKQAPAVAACLRAGVPVVSDKPIAGDWAALHEAREAAEGGPALVTEFNMRIRPEFRAAAEAVAAGEIGEPVLATAQKSYRFGDSRPDFYKRREDYGSTLLWIGSHAIDAVRFVTGKRFARVAATHGNVARPEYGEFEDHAVAMFTLQGGGSALIHADYLRPAAAATHGDNRLRVAGSEGVLDIRDDRCWLTTREAPEREITDRVAPLPAHTAMLEAALAGDTRFFGTEQSLELARVLLAARDAADRGNPVAL